MTTKNIKPVSACTLKVKSALDYPPGPGKTNHNQSALKVREGTMYSFFKTTFFLFGDISLIRWSVSIVGAISEICAFAAVGLGRRSGFDARESVPYGAAHSHSE